MKKLSINLLGIILITTMLFSCGNNSNDNTEINDNNDNNDVVVDDDGLNVIDFSKFEHYATILNKADLITQFGETNLEDITVYYAEGTVEKEATVLTNPQNGYIIQYVWEDDNSTTSFIEASYNVYDRNYELVGTQKVEAENGLYLGMSLPDLVTWNGDDIQFYGFGWDYSGSVFETANSNLSNSRVKISLDLLSYDGAEFTLGDVELSSDDSRLDGLDIIVYSFTMYIE
ncbi:MAG: hypothetical protein JXR68_05315 [Bacteroidales bacterium]|nr:hypothetical protein [Bacteroidales bacterium]